MHTIRTPSYLNYTMTYKAVAAKSEALKYTILYN